MKQQPKEKIYMDLLFTVINFSNIHLMNISISRKGTPIYDSPIESFHGVLKKETLYNNITN